MMSRMRVRTRDIGWLAFGGRTSETVFWLSYLFCVYHMDLAWVYLAKIKLCKLGFLSAHRVR